MNKKSNKNSYCRKLINYMAKMKIRASDCYAPPKQETKSMPNLNNINEIDENDTKSSLPAMYFETPSIPK